MWTKCILALLVIIPVCTSQDLYDPAVLSHFISSSVSKMASEFSSPVQEDVPPFFGVNQDDIPYCKADFLSNLGSESSSYEGLNKVPIVQKLASQLPDKREQINLFDGRHSLVEVIFTLAESSFRNQHQQQTNGEHNLQKNVVLDVVEKMLSGLLSKKAENLDGSMKSLNNHFRAVFCNLTRSVAVSTNARVTYALSKILTSVLKQAESFRHIVKEISFDVERTSRKIIDAGQLILAPGRKDVNFLVQRGFQLVGELISRIQRKMADFIVVSLKELSGVPKFFKLYVTEMFKIEAFKAMNQFISPMAFGGNRYPGSSY